MKSSDLKDLCKEPVFKGFYDSFLQGAKNFALYKCGDEAQALDLTQEAFIKIWENCSCVDFAKAKTYLFTTINNMFLNTVKHNKVVLNYEKNSNTDDKSFQDPVYILEEKEFKLKLQQAIANLNEGQREVFLMNRIDGKKYREIAELLDISVKAVEKRMSLALKSLREEIPNI
ncbi:RNA polymerase sigma factor [Leeuwenhoekiella aequorea]|uniref:RNA polymerase sigma-70 factor (ECF subfamily) n=1 Tax=Leeuwenhoekiella aequorea TaxID=283736 RepID=A0A4Q0P7P1_9FLAO|nr:sigma-70 family RNA polymerase sigma factor [Leeuwenhoekiella aequorea]RXG22647.1 RNA polymerase sigma-70 factor (ECF subfamily) [Leeuwenhoekiella aequorea]